MNEFISVEFDSVEEHGIFSFVAELFDSVVQRRVAGGIAGDWFDG